MPVHPPRLARCSGNLCLRPSDDGTIGLRCSASGPRVGEAAVYQLAQPLGPAANYFEVQILEAGATDDEACLDPADLTAASICVGLAHREHSLSRAPGSAWGSVGYSASDGALLLSRRHRFGPASGPLDRIGCGILFPPEACGPKDGPEGDQELEEGASVSIFFTRNGERIGRPVAFPCPVGGLFPTLGLQAPGCELLLFRPELLSEGEEEEEEAAGAMELDDEEEEAGPDAWGSLLGFSPGPGGELRFLPDQLEPPSSGRRRTGLAIARQPLSRRRPYVEVALLEVPGAAVALGLCRRDQARAEMPGWRGGSLGLHSDDGMLYIGNGTGQRRCLGPPSGAGDRLGVGLIFPRRRSERMTGPEEGKEEEAEEEEVQAFFTRNGRILGRQALELPPTAAFPCVGVVSESGPPTRVRFEFSPLSG